MRVCIHTATGRMLEAQSFATPGTLISNMAQFYPEAELHEEEWTQEQVDMAMFAQNPNAAIDAQILALEATVTQRRLREAALTEAGKAWLADVDAQIAALRAQMV